MSKVIEKNVFIDSIGTLIKITPKFPGKWRLVQYWMNRRDNNAMRPRVLPGGCKVICDFSVPYECMVWLGREEQEDLELLMRLLKPGQTFIDCGANIGIWTIVAASAVGKAGNIYAFEPNPNTFKKLHRNVYEISNLDSNVNLLKSAVGNEQKEIQFLCTENHNVSQITSENDSRAILVSVVTLDSIFKEQKVHGLKIDVEGFELEVLKGAENILKAYHPWLCVEFNTSIAQVNTLGSWSVHQYLSSLGYVCRQFKHALNSNNTSILPDSWETSGYCNLYYSMK